MSTIRFIADTHLFDASSMLWRPQFEGLEEYAEVLIHDWNSTTKPDDLVFHLGDVGNQCPRLLEVLRELNGRKVLILGNHDVEHGYQSWPSDIFQGVYSELEYENLYLCHDPTRMHPYPGYRIHGHHHTYSDWTMGMARMLYIADTYRLNCAADIIGNRPLTLNELIIKKEDMIMSRR